MGAFHSHFGGLFIKMLEFLYLKDRLFIAIFKTFFKF